MTTSAAAIGSSDTARVIRTPLFEGGGLRIGLFAARPISDACGDIERQEQPAIVLPLSGVFSKHDAPGRHVVGTPSQAVFFAANAPYRIGFPGALGDRALTLRFDEALTPELLRRSAALEAPGLLPADAMMLRNLLWSQLRKGGWDPFEIEACALDLVSLSLLSLRAETPSPRPSTRARWLRAIERVKEAVALDPADSWSVARVASIANMSPYHLCHVFRRMTGASVYDYVLRERLALALDAVLDGGDLTTIALDAGFASHSHFTARFGVFFGRSPAVVRQAASAGRGAQLRKITTARRR